MEAGDIAVWRQTQDLAQQASREAIIAVTRIDGHESACAEKFAHSLEFERKTESSFGTMRNVIAAAAKEAGDHDDALRKEAAGKIAEVHSRVDELAKLFNDRLLQDTRERVAGAWKVATLAILALASIVFAGLGFTGVF